MTLTTAAIIFDFDGLMVDTETAAFTAWSEIYQEHGAVLHLEQWVACVGSSYASFDPVQNLAAQLDRALDRTALIAEKERRKADACSRAPAMAGVVERLAEAAALGLAVAVASSSPRDWVTGHLARLGLLARIPVIRTSEDVARVKPFPDLYLAAAAGLGVQPAACLVVEDSLNGVRAAKAAAMLCYAVPNAITRSLDFTAADGVLSSLAAVRLADIVRR